MAKPKNKGNGRIEQLKKAMPLVDLARRLGVQFIEKGGEYWASCPIHGPEKTPSFAVRDNVFYCQGCGAKGDQIGLLMKMQNLDFKAAMDTLGEMTGIASSKRESSGPDDSDYDSVPRQAEPEWAEGYKKFEQTFTNVGEIAGKRRPAIELTKWMPKVDALQNNPAALKYLLDVRGITAQTAKDLYLGYAQTHPFRIDEAFEEHRNSGWICFPRVANSKVVAVKFRSIACKTFSQMANMDSKALFNIETINSMEPVFITEGEYDSCIMEQCGFRAVSIQSASNHKLMPATINALKKATAVYIAGDNDGGVGNSAMEQLAIALGGGGKGNGRGAYILKWKGAKDANDFFLNVCAKDADAFSDKMPALIREAESRPIVGFTSVTEQLLSNKGGSDMANDFDRLHLPISQEADKLAYNPRGAVVVLYSTYTGTGKSVLANQIAVHEAKRGEVVVSYTPEIRDNAFLALIAAQTFGGKGVPLDRSGKITEAQYAEAARLLRPTYDINKAPAWFHVRPDVQEIEFYAGYQLPDGGLEETLDFIEYAVRATQATRFIIDTLQRIAIPEDGQNQIQAEGTAVKRLEKIATTYGCIFILIGQSNKEGDSIKETNKDSYGVLRGSREIQDVAYAVYLLHRKKQGRESSGGGLLSLDAELILNKGRVQGGTARSVPLIYHHPNSLFLPGAGKHSEPDGSMQFGDAPPHTDADF